MRGTSKPRPNLMRQLQRTVAFVCVMCFVMVFLFSATLATAIAGHEHEAPAGCPRTLDPVCNCENDGFTPLIRIQEKTQTKDQTHTHSNGIAACLPCTIVQKMVSQLRELGVSASPQPYAPISSSAETAVCLSPVLSGFSTPVELKTKISN